MDNDIVINIESDDDTDYMGRPLVLPTSTKPVVINNRFDSLESAAKAFARVVEGMAEFSSSIRKYRRR